MEKEIAQLKEKYGTYRKLADALEVTERHVWRIAHGKSSPSKALQYRIRQELRKV
jgi:transcriptional regulator with XRE-family HTH domain